VTGGCTGDPAATQETEMTKVIFRIMLNGELIARMERD
jgi:hypothetical protein